MIHINDIKKSYSKSGINAVDGLTLHIRAGEVFGFLGPNGAGKTTTIKMITGILDIDSGSITVCGKDVAHDPIAVKSQIGFVNDSGVLYEKLTGREFVDFMADVYGVDGRTRQQLCDKYLAAFNLTSAFDQSIGTYSHGMKQKIAIIGALVHSPSVLILDEPMVGLDPQSVRELKDIMKEYASSGRAVFFSTHVLDVAEKVCDRIGIISKGRMLMVGSIDEIRAANKDRSLEDFFLMETGA